MLKDTSDQNNASAHRSLLFTLYIKQTTIKKLPKIVLYKLLLIIASGDE